MKKVTKMIVALVLILATLSPMAAMASSYGAKVLTAAMSVYTSGKKNIGTLGRGTHVTVTAIKGNWVRLKYKGGTYYAKISNLVFNTSKSAVTTKDAYFEFVTKSSYSSGTYYKATLAKGTKVYICGRSGSKYLVTNANRSAYGYISKSAVKK